jgi:hypothetical protein
MERRITTLRVCPSDMRASSFFSLNFEVRIGVQRESATGLQSFRL